MMKANISTIERHRYNIDGEGIRTLILFSGCSLRCKYCINKYTWANDCNDFQYTPEELLSIVSVDSVYFRATNGGITFGGGEPLLQSQFISDFIDISPLTWNFTVETSLSVPVQNIKMITNKISNFIVDIKSMDFNIYHDYTGGDLNIAKSNLIELINIVGKEKILVRVPIIPSYADKLSQISTINELNKMGIENIDNFQYLVKNF